MAPPPPSRSCTALAAVHRPFVYVSPSPSSPSLAPSPSPPVSLALPLTIPLTDAVWVGPSHAPSLALPLPVCSLSLSLPPSLSPSLPLSLSLSLPTPIRSRRSPRSSPAAGAVGPWRLGSHSPATAQGANATRARSKKPAHPSTCAPWSHQVPFSGCSARLPPPSCECLRLLLLLLAPSCWLLAAIRCCLHAHAHASMHTNTHAYPVAENIAAAAAAICGRNRKNAIANQQPRDFAALSTGGLAASNRRDAGRSTATTCPSSSAC